MVLTFSPFNPLFIVVVLNMVSVLVLHFRLAKSQQWGEDLHGQLTALQVLVVVGSGFLLGSLPSHSSHHSKATHRPFD